MHTTEELFELVAEDDMYMITADFWAKYDDALIFADESEMSKAYTALLAYQNGWLACKNYYKVRD